MTTAATDISRPGKASALPSVRGLVLGQNRRGEVVELTTLRQWLRLSAEAQLVRKVDYWEPVATSARVLPMLEEATHLGLQLSLRTTSATPLPLLPELRDAGLFDVLLCVDVVDVDVISRWAQACVEAHLPLRVQLLATAIPETPSGALVAALGKAKHISMALEDPISPGASRPALENIMALAKALADAEVAVHLLDLPFCAVPERLWPWVVNEAQRLATPQHYQPAALDFALKMAPLSSRRIHQAVELSLGQGASFHNLIDNAVLPWILEKPRWFFWLWFLHKLTRRLPLRRSVPAPLPEDLSALEHALADHRAARARYLGPQCATCRLHPVCDHPGESFKRAFPGHPLIPVSGEATHDPLVFLSEGATWHDPIDTERLDLPEKRLSLAEEARRRIAGETPTREIPAESYCIEHHATHRMPASVRWFSFSTAEMQSTVLARLSPPFTLALTVGGGIADAVGFSVGRTARILCPMTAYDHQIVLHVDAQGQYVLLRDGVTVPPATLHDAHRVPERLGSVVEPRIALINVDGQIVTQTVLLWENKTQTTVATARHSVVIVCSRFSRRLQAALQALAHQQGPQPGELEVIVAYVPGIDATDDVLDSLQAVYPALTLRRIPFAPDRLRAKGFLINECTALASGEWITLLDADILLPPDYFVRLDALEAEVVFAAPEGRHMLDATATARILLGEIRPWDHYNELRQQAAEYRHHESDGVPPGFCQSVRRRVFDSVRYEELDHFEGSDWWFSRRVMDQFGPVRRLDGMAVLHLDHGGSQWYGTGKQR
ncbi:MAG: glycosyltransferase family 2 protein [Candidatus Hydrogenedentes bacterium]|nr:glycosyltransferase family 2 protein [Candidatus Hydrogenedentota bacterium]